MDGWIDRQIDRQQNNTRFTLEQTRKEKKIIEYNDTEQNRREQKRTELNRPEQNRQQNRMEQQQSRMEQNRVAAEQNRIEQNRVEQSRIEQSRVEQNRTEQNRTGIGIGIALIDRLTHRQPGIQTVRQIGQVRAGEQIGSDQIRLVDI